MRRSPIEAAFGSFLIFMRFMERQGSQWSVVVCGGIESLVNLAGNFLRVCVCVCGTWVCSSHRDHTAAC